MKEDMSFAGKLESIRNDIQRLVATYDIKKINKLFRFTTEKPTRVKRNC